MEAIENKEIVFSLNDEDVRLAIKDYIWKSYPDMELNTDDIKIIGNNENIKANVTILHANRISNSINKVDTSHPDYKGDLGRA